MDQLEMISFVILKNAMAYSGATRTQVELCRRLQKIQRFNGKPSKKYLKNVPFHDSKELNHRRQHEIHSVSDEIETIT